MINIIVNKKVVVIWWHLWLVWYIWFIKLYNG